MYLVNYRKDGVKKRWALDKERISIGRGTHTDITLDDPRVSRIHAYIIRDKDSYIFVDSDSTNGSFINGVRVSRQLLNPGDIIRIGDYELHFVEMEGKEHFTWDNSEVIVETQVPTDYIKTRLDELTKETPSEESKGESVDALEKVSAFNLSRIAGRIKGLYQAFEQLSSVLSTQELYEIIIKSVFALLPTAQNVCLIIGETDKHVYKPIMMRNRKGEVPSSLRISKTALRLAVKNRLTLLASDVPHDPLFKKTETASELHLQSILCAPLLIKQKVIGAIYVDNREEKDSFNQIDAEFLTALANHSSIALENARLYHTLQQAYHQSILALQNIIEARDPSTMGHTYRTARLAVGIAREMGLSEEQCQLIKTAADLHDIGKICLDARIINKPGDLSYPEYLSVQEHVAVSEKILAPIEYLRDVLPIIRQHHERYDGTGYPEGLQKEEILIEARVLGLADAFDALISQRSYKDPIPIDEALKWCWEEAGKQFDPQVVKALESFIKKNRSAVETLISNPSKKI
ncbi:HD domain-containing protein [Candidatus Sumerlaeota bacterium]|nr:HD domain-containing protein [Candidatus Sumerlaeota bacterium]